MVAGSSSSRLKMRRQAGLAWACARFPPRPAAESGCTIPGAVLADPCGTKVDKAVRDSTSKDFRSMQAVSEARFGLRGGPRFAIPKPDHGAANKPTTTDEAPHVL